MCATSNYFFGLFAFSFCESNYIINTSEKSTRSDVEEVTWLPDELWIFEIH